MKLSKGGGGAMEKEKKSRESVRNADCPETQGAGSKEKTTGGKGKERELPQSKEKRIPPQGVLTGENVHSRGGQRKKGFRKMLGGGAGKEKEVDSTSCFKGGSSGKARGEQFTGRG